MSEAAGRPLPDPSASLAASMLVATWVVATLEAHRVFSKSHNIKKSNTAVLTIVNQRVLGANGALKGTRYA